MYLYIDHYNLISASLLSPLAVSTRSAVVNITRRRRRRKHQFHVWVSKSRRLVLTKIDCHTWTVVFPNLRRHILLNLDQENTHTRTHKLFQFIKLCFEGNPVIRALSCHNKLTIICVCTILCTKSTFCFPSISWKVPLHLSALYDQQVKSTTLTQEVSYWKAPSVWKKIILYLYFIYYNNANYQVSVRASFMLYTTK